MCEIRLGVLDAWKAQWAAAPLCPPLLKLQAFMELWGVPWGGISCLH